MKKTRLLKTYSGATRLMAPVLPLWLGKRAKKGKEDPGRLSERDGVTTIAKPDGKLVWMHGASVGESQMLRPLIDKVLAQYANTSVLITTGTVTSAELLEKTLPKRAIHQYAPIDHPKAVKNFLNHWRPDVAIFAESELWPNMIMGAYERQIPLALINARMSASSIERWGKSAKTVKSLLNCFQVILAANTETANGLSWLSGRDIESAGNLKDAAAPLSVDTDELKTFKTAFGRRAIWCATSTHKGEEELVLDAAAHVKDKRPSALLVLAPRHPERKDEIIALLKDRGLNFKCRSDNALPDKDTDVFVFDTIGDLGLVYRLTKIAFIGGSLVKGLSGHNPLEAARLDCAIITGSHISSFADTYMALMAFDGVKRILTPDQLAPSVLELLKDTNLRNSRIKAARDFAGSRDDVLEYVWDTLTPLWQDGALS